MFVNKISLNMKQFPIRLRLARSIMGMSLGKLSEKMGYAITKQSLSRYEAGIMRPKSDVLATLAAALEISTAYFEGTNMVFDEPMLRSSSADTLSAEQLVEIEALLSFKAEQYLKVECQSGMTTHFSNPLKGVCVSNLEEVINAANLLREQWHCGDGPIPSVLRLMERKGIKVLNASLPSRVIGLSTWADKKHPLVLIDMSSDKTNCERLRFTACHELGHLLLTFPDGAKVEQLCNQFASFFLFPRHTFKEEIGGDFRESLALEELIDLRELYGVSIAAQIHEAWDLHLISRQHYDWWYEEMIKKNVKEEGWGSYRFPETLGREKRMRAIVRLVRE